MNSLETTTISKVMWRLMPLLCFSFFMSYVDRVNIGFAAVTMNPDLGFSAATFGLGASMYFISYMFLEVPSNLILHKVGARLWIARIMFTWGVISTAFAFIPHITLATGFSNQSVFYVLRFLLGAAEAGLFPGVVYYMSQWFPQSHRGKMIGIFMASVPASSVLVAPISGWILDFNGLGLTGWQWLFVIEGVPSLLAALLLILFLPDSPGRVKWLNDDEKSWLVSEVSHNPKEEITASGVWRAITNPQVLALSLVWICEGSCTYAFAFWLPQIVKAFGLSNFATGFVTAIPYLLAPFAMVWYGRRSDRTGERRNHAMVAQAAAGLGIAASTLFADPFIKIIYLSIAAIGIFSFQPPFWAMGASILRGTAGAAAIAMINSVGNLAGVGSPYVIGLIKDATGSFTGGLLYVSALAGIGILITYFFAPRNSVAAKPLPATSERTA